MKELALRVLLLLVGGILLAPFVYPVGRMGTFRVRLVDERTGAGLPDVRVTVENGIVGTTEFDGSVLFWLDNSLMDRTVRFTIEHRGVTTNVQLPVNSGGLAVVDLPAP